MNNEIKEILDRLSKEENYIQHSYCRLFNYEANTLLDYITNLEDTLIDKQECIDAYTEIINNRDEKITNLQQQLHQASLDIQELTEKDIGCPSWCDKLTNLQQRSVDIGEYNTLVNKYNEVFKENKNLKSQLKGTTYCYDEEKIKDLQQIEQDHKETNATLMSELAKLEEENEVLKKKLDRRYYKNECKRLEQENERLKKDCQLLYKNGNKDYLELEREYIDYQNQAEKITIDLTKKWQDYKSRCEETYTILNNIYMLDNVTITNNACEEIDKAINILQNGSDSE